MIERQPSSLVTRGLTDDQDRLLMADDPLAELQERCGGTLPGTLAVPELLELVQHGRRMGLRIAREFSAFDGRDFISGLARIHPLSDNDGGGCEVLVENWQRRPAPEPSSREVAHRLDAIDRVVAEIVIRLDDAQRTQVIGAMAEDAIAFQRNIEGAPGSVWTDHVTLDGMAHRQPLHWRLLDGANCKIEGSDRKWRVRLLPIGNGTGVVGGVASGEPRGFELLFIADSTLDDSLGEAQTGNVKGHTNLVGGSLTPVLRQPIARIIANAETIRARLAGPLRAEYSEYAGNIASAGQHLTALLDDLADLEVVEAAGFSTAREPVDLSDAARRAAGILGVRARARNIELVLPIAGDTSHMATGEFRRVLQILINLIGNAIAYSPEGSEVTIRAETFADEGLACVTVHDEGPGVGEDQARHIFNKFERLGRENDGGSGLGLYISHRLAEAMDGMLDIANPGEQGATFRLRLPLDTQA